MSLKEYNRHLLCCRDVTFSFSLSLSLSLSFSLSLSLGPPKDAERAKEFIRDMFLSVNPDEKKHIFPHFTTATDTENIQRVFEAVKTTVLEENLRDYNLIV